MAAHDDRKDRLEPALVHASTVYGLFVTQRQNLVSFYLVALGFLSAAYVAALRDRLRAAAVAVCALGAAASAAAILQDRRLRQLMRAAEEACGSSSADWRRRRACRRWRSSRGPTPPRPTRRPRPAG